MDKAEAEKIVERVAAGEAFDMAVAVRALCVVLVGLGVQLSKVRGATSSAPGGKKK
jgi:hypothetical protein